ncbi:UDP-galactose/UDP-glucose transporter 5B isoform X2 [Cryptomeria japonica]|uniref:UDP-galactose/UDP-glucose transporter 5B isoform X2 n=1 Tax=Cryptomeria japonica TaxID=3369 RepID=UPI0027DA3854|nr:UDP-galactose/UDP-glucose transporter 5B isoform X2 [Cryptomeria japonica]
MGSICAGTVEKTTSKLVVAVAGIMSTLVVYGVLQEKIMRNPYGDERAFFKYSLFLVLCNRVLTSTAAAIFLLANRKTMGPAAPLYKYGAISLSNILTTTCQYEALKYVSFPVQTLAKCAKMIPVMASEDITPYNTGKESSFWGIFLMLGYLGFDGFTSTFQDKLFKGYNMEIYNQIFYTTLCSCAISMIGLFIQGHFLPAINFVLQHKDCFFDIALLSMVATASQFFISYTIRTFGALTFATIMTTRQLVSILLSCIWFAHPLSWVQWIGAGLVFGSLYFKNFFNAQRKKFDLPKQQKQAETEENDPLLNQEKNCGKDSTPKSFDISIR